MFKPEFISLLEESVGEQYAKITLEALEKEPSTSIRLNPAKLKECPFPDAESIPWSPYGYILKERPVFTLDPLFHAGAYYVQESSAMMVGELFRKVTEELEGPLRAQPAQLADDRRGVHVAGDFAGAHHHAEGAGLPAHGASSSMRSRHAAISSSVTPAERA